MRATLEPFVMWICVGHLCDEPRALLLAYPRGDTIPEKSAQKIFHAADKF
jgi:hypothetical protein